MDYTSLITSEHAKQPRFGAFVDAITKPLSDITGSLESMQTLVTDVDTAEGAQLDVIGIWVGLSRKQSVPIPNAYFSFDTENLGWNQGIWKGAYESTQGIVELDDSTYRAVMKAKIGSNYWRGSVEELNVIGSTSLSQLGVLCFVIDNMDMTCTIYIIGFPSAALLELIKRGICPPITAGVRVTGYILASVAGAPFFALDVYTTAEVAGLDFGSFGAPT